MSYRPSGQVGGFTEELDSQSPESFSLIDRHTAFEGTLTSSRDLRIEGEMRGTVRCQGLLYVAEGSDIDATVEAANVTVAGQLQGNIVCRGKLQILPSGRVIAKVITESLVINEGAVYEGELQMDLSSITVTNDSIHSSSDTTPTILRRFGTDQNNGSSTTTPPSTSRKDGE
ncbi:MAG TPA: polymer-forming cytoskeletal protein [Nitrolancea sp.]|nr:polymer-forming cytoskeletal protein [Nitrolancea sp.]